MLGTVFAVAGDIAITVGALGVLIEIADHFDVPIEPGDLTGLAFTVVFFLGLASSIAAFVLTLLGLARGPRGPRILSGIGLGFTLLPILVIIGIYVVNVIAYSS